MTMLVRFWVNHHLLDLTGRPVWRVVAGRSRQYVVKVLQGEWSCFWVVRRGIRESTTQCTRLCFGQGITSS